MYKKHKKTYKKTHTTSRKTASHKHIFSWKEAIKRSLVAWFLVFFAALVIQLPNRVEVISQDQSMTFILAGTPEDWGMDPDLLQSHGAASQWDFLFDDTTGTVYSGTMDTQEQPSSVNIPGLPDKEDSFIDEGEVDQILLSGSSSTLFTGVMQVEDGGKVEFIAIDSVGGSSSLAQEKTFKNCTAPWGEIVEHKDYILAYEQRKDVNTVCNIQKRYCYDGKLTGSYKQKSCKENEVYSYTKVEPISYNQEGMDPYIQPKDPSLSGADFDVHGKINTTEKPIDVWPDGKSTGKPKAVTYTTQTSTKSANCITSWGETVKNGQFIRAYVSPIGLIDMPCEVELRICTNGVLKGTFTNRTCTFKNMTYRDYLVGNTDSSIPTPGDLLNAVDSEEQKTKDSASSFWEWLSIYF